MGLVLPWGRRAVPVADHLREMADLDERHVAAIRAIREGPLTVAKLDELDAVLTERRRLMTRPLDREPAG